MIASTSQSTKTVVPFPSSPKSTKLSNAQRDPDPSISEAQDEFGRLDRITSESRMSTRSRKAYYTPQNPRQFSRSAAKRESVIALGSIAHLQHYFVKNGLASREKPNNSKHMVLAIPGRETTLTEEDEEMFDDLPEPAPPPPVPAQPYFPPGRALPNLTNLESATKEVMAQLDQVCDSWGLVQLAATRAPSAASNRSTEEPVENRLAPINSPSSQDSSTFLNSPGHEFVVNLLTLTTQAVRSVQKFIRTLPDPDLFCNMGPMGGDLHRRMSHLELSTAARPRISKSMLGPARSPSPVPTDSIRVTSRSSFDPFSLFKRRTVSPSPQSIKDDPLSTLRRLSLDVLGCLKDLEHKFRIPGSATPTANDELFASHHKIGESSHSAISDRVSTPPLITSTGTDGEDSYSNSTELMLPSMSWEYRSDVGLEDVRKEATVVKEWLECVDSILESVSIINGRGQRRRKMGSANKTVSAEGKPDTHSGLGVKALKKTRNPFKKILNSSILTPEPEDEANPVPDISLAESGTDGGLSDREEYSEEDLPDWARHDMFTPAGDVDQQVSRLFSCLVHYLPVDSLKYLCSPHQEEGSRIGFLDSLSDGTLLCLVYNVALRQSQRPWGFIPVESIHDLISLTNSPDDATAASSPPQFGMGFRRSSHSPHYAGSEHGSTDNHPHRVGLTFRRMENMRVWSAALKLRYLIKSQLTQPTGDEATKRGTMKVTKKDDVIVFDPNRIARKSEGWEDMLQTMMLRWLECLMSEKREEVLGFT